jgi:asparagine synthetase B (glutamine-hydrolysing)
VCGIFGFTGPGAPDPELLAAAACEAGRRGPHGHGWATRYPGGTFTVRREFGPVTANLPALLRVAAPAVLGHARLATTGSWDDPEGLQPVTCGRHAIAHNGTVYNPADVAPGADVATDTHALAIAYETERFLGGTPAGSLAAVVARADQRAWAIVVLDADGTLVGHRHGHPLHAYRDPTGLYLSSRPFHPGCTLLPEDKLLELTCA